MGAGLDGLVEVLPQARMVFVEPQDCLAFDNIFAGTRS